MVDNPQQAEKPGTGEHPSVIIIGAGENPENV